MPAVASLDPLTLSPMTPTPAAVVGWTHELHRLGDQIGPRFARSEVRQRVLTYVSGLLSPLERKNGWQLAEQAGDRTPYATQHLLGRAQWDADAVRNDLQAYVRAHLADPEALLIIDETSFLKKGTHSVGVGSQYSGITGHIENCQVGVFLVYAGTTGQTFYDRALYLPKEWAADPERRRRAGVPEEVGFATKPQMARRMVERALDAGLPVGWVVGDEVYGNDGWLRHAVEQRQQRYALTVGAAQSFVIGWGHRRARAAIADLPPEAWQRLSAGDGSKGPRLYDWARVRLNSAHSPEWERWLVARRNLQAPDDPRSLAYFVVFAPGDTSLAETARVIGRRWAIETGFQESKGEVGLDQYEVRSWHGWHRHITLALLAHAFLSVMRAQGNTPSVNGATEGKKGDLRQGSLRVFKQTRGLCCP